MILTEQDLPRIEMAAIDRGEALVFIQKRLWPESRRPARAKLRNHLDRERVRL